MILTALISSCHWKIIVPFSLQKKSSETHFKNINSELRQNRTEKTNYAFQNISKLAI